MKRLLATLLVLTLALCGSAWAAPISGPIQGAIHGPISGPLGSWLNHPSLVFSFDSIFGTLTDLVSGAKGSNDRATARTVVRGGLLLTIPAEMPAFGDQGLSIEPAATNLLVYSEELDDVSWTLGEGTISPDATTAPDGNLTADKLIAASGLNNSPFISREITGLSDDTIYTLSAFYRAAEVVFARMRIKGKDGTFSNSWFNLTTGSVGTTSADGAGITALADGWYRCWINQDIGSGATVPLVVLAVSETDGVSGFDGDGVKGAYFWGAQLESGTVPTCYKPTAASTVSNTGDENKFALIQQLKDILSIAEGPATAEGTLVLKGWTPGFSATDLNTNERGIIVGCNNATNGLLYYRDISGTQYIASDDGVNLSRVALAWNAGQSYEHVVRWSSSDGKFQVCSKPSSASAYTCGSEQTFDGAFSLGSILWLGYAPAHPWEMSSVVFYNKSLSPAQLAWMDWAEEWLPEAQDYYPAQLVAYAGDYHHRLAAGR